MSDTSAAATEVSLLLHQHSDQRSNDLSITKTAYRQSPKNILWIIGVTVTAIVSVVGGSIGFIHWSKSHLDTFDEAVVVSNYTTTTSSSKEVERQRFPANFVWGVATSSYQIEGAVHEDNRGTTIWDEFVRIPGNILDGSTGDVTDNHYHLYKEDILLMQSLNIQAYRFSIAWSRILPNGRGPVNLAGIRFYNDLIDTLLLHNIEPWITLFHWDLPQALQVDYNHGWLDFRTVHCFVEYANVVFQHFSHKVNRFITINEPWTYSVVGHGSGIHAPGRKDSPSTEPYLVAHNFLLAHMKVAKLYKAKYAGTDGLIGISNCGDFRYPKNQSNTYDQEAAVRAMLFQWGWFVEPLVFGNYPSVMRERLGDRLPNFTIDEQHDLIGSADFFGLNYYSSLLASTPNTEATYSEYWADMHVDLTDDPSWSRNAMGWNIVPDGLREMLHWVAERYNNPLIYITENGSAEPEKENDAESVIHDESRRLFLERHIEACSEAISMDKVNLAGYFAWSFLDNFEWQFGYQRRFGICHVNYTTQQRTPRDSALWYSDHIGHNSKNNNPDTSGVRDPFQHHKKHRSLAVETVQQTLKRKRPFQLPTNVLIGYGSNCDAVRQAVYDGVNIVIWSFVDVIRVASPVDASALYPSRSLLSESDQLHSIYTVSTTLNLTAVRSLINDLYISGYGDVLHFASVGGWNGAHIDTDIPVSVWYTVFNESIGDIFDGIDWDLEGNDMMISPYNFFSLDCLTHVGKISQVAKQDGKFISIAPPQSYMNINSSRFSRYVNLTDSTTTALAVKTNHRPAPYSTFTYYGSNVYAYLLQQYGIWIDLVSIQFYESYSDATYKMKYEGINASDLFLQYIDKLVSSHESFYVNFTEDTDVLLPGQNVSLPLYKLVFGLGNGWTSQNNDNNNKTMYISPDQLNITWQRLRSISPWKLPRGFMFWTIDSEGENGIYFAKELYKILQQK